MDSDNDSDYQIIWSDSDDDGLDSDDINILSGFKNSESDSDSD